MFDAGAYGARMAGYLHLPEPPLYTKLGSGHFELAVTHLDAAMGYSEPASSIPAEKAFSIHLHLRPTSEGRLWLGGRLLPTIDRLAGGVTVLDLEEDPVCFFPNPSDWPPHAKFHNGQTLAMSLLLGGLTILLAWWPSNHVPEMVLAAAAAGSLYFISQSAAILYPNTAYFDPEFKRLTILGVPLAAAIAMVELSAVAVASWLGLRVAR